MMKNKKILYFAIVLVCSCWSYSYIHKKQKIHPPPGGCCLSQGTLVRLPNGKNILIENLKSGDTILAFNRTTEKYVSSRVLKTFQTEHAGFVKLKFGALYRNGVLVFDTTAIIISQDHPIWVKEKGWCSTQPEMTKRVLMMRDVKKIEKNDFCYTADDLSMEGFSGKALLVSIEKFKGIVKAYTIVQLENTLDCFVANGIVVGTEPIQMESGGD